MFQNQRRWVCVCVVGVLGFELRVSYLLYYLSYVSSPVPNVVYS
jgi:hypothetical protein